MSESTKDGIGLDKGKRLNERRLGKEEEETEQDAKLEPTFPYVMEKFDAGYFEL